MLIALLCTIAACGGGDGGDSGVAPSPPTSPTVLFHPTSLTATEGNSATFRAIASGTAPLSFTWQRNSVPIPGATSDTYVLGSVAIGDSGSRYRVIISNSAGSVTSNEAVLTVVASVILPSITAGPVSLQVLEGQPAEFSVTASGTAPLSYQWRRNGVNLTDATGPSYRINTTTPSDDNSQFDVTVSNSAGTLASVAATLRVTATPVVPTILVQPQPASVLVGQSATFSVTAGGTAPFAYQWKKNGVDVPGATGSAFAYTPMSLDEDGTLFSVQVSNSVSTIVSQTARLTVKLGTFAPQITAHPLTRVVTLGAAPTYSVSATGSEPLTYLWAKNGVGILGVDSLTYVAPAATAADHGSTFTSVVSNEAGMKMSRPARLFIKSGVMGQIDLVAGTLGGAGRIDGTGVNSRFEDVSAMTLDANGNLLIADNLSHTIRRATPAGVVTTIAGSADSSGSADGDGGSARFNKPSGLTVDMTGNLIVADTANHTIRRISPAGTVTTLAGFPSSFGTSDGQGAAARFNSPSGLAVNAAGNVIVADTYNHSIRRITPAGVVTTVAGQSARQGSADGPAASATFYYPSAVAVDPQGTIFVADMLNSTVRRISVTGQVTTVAGAALNPGSADGPLGVSRLDRPIDLVSDGIDSLLILDGLRVRRLNSAGNLTTLFELGAGTPSVTGDVPDPVSFSNHATSIARSAAGALFIGHQGGPAVVRVDTTGQGVLFVGKGLPRGSTNGSGTAARFGAFGLTAIDSAGNIVVLEPRFGSGDSRIRRVTPSGSVTTVAMLPEDINCVAVNHAGDIYVAATGIGIPAVRVVTGEGAVSTLPLGPLISGLRCLVLDVTRGSLILAINEAIYRVPVTGGTPILLAGSPGQPGSMDGSGSNARFENPISLAIDATGNIFVADVKDNQLKIRRVTPTGDVTTVTSLTVDLPHALRVGELGFSIPFAAWVNLAVDGIGNIYVANMYQKTIDRIDSSGNVSILAGNPGSLGVVLGSLPSSLSYPSGISATPDGKRLYVFDEGALLRIQIP